MGLCYSIYKENSELNQLQNITSHKDIPEYNLDGKTLKAIIPEDGVYDGDTCKVIAFIDGRLFKMKTRSLGYDSPEMKADYKKYPKDDPNAQKEQQKQIKKAKEAKKRFIELTRGIVTVKFEKPDKYGRHLVTIYNNNKNINEMMVEEKHGYNYYGGTKH